MDRSSLISDLEKQFSENPRRVFARLANEYRKSGDTERAIEMCRAHIPQQPGYISGHIVLGQALFDRGEMEDARQTFETALALDPENLIALRQMGDITRQRGDTDAARDWYQRLLDVDPQNEEVSSLLASLTPSSADRTSAVADPTSDPMAGWSRLDPVTESQAAIEEELAATAGGVSGSYMDFPGISKEQSPLAESHPDVSAFAPSDLVAEHEPLDLRPSLDEAEAGSSPEESDALSLASERGVEIQDWRPALSAPGFDLEREFSVESEARPFEGIDYADPVDKAERLVLDQEDALPEAATVMGRDTGSTDISDLLQAEQDPSSTSLSGTKEPPAGGLSEAYSYDPVLGLTFDETPVSTDETPAAFVTETMAELYLQQGFREEALSVYRRLVEQNPADEELRTRVAHLERGEMASIGGLSSIPREGDVPEVTPETGSVRSFLSALAARHSSRPRTERSAARADAAAGLMENAAKGSSDSSELFGPGNAPPEDENAAQRLAGAYSEENLKGDDETRGQPTRAASRGLSLDEVFRGADSRADKSSGGNTFSFDEFFSEGGGGERAGDSAGAADNRDASGKSETSDLEAFNAWLEGLKK